MEKKNILVVEDEKDAARLLASFLKRNGYTVSVSHSVEDAEKKLNSEKFKHILLDLNLPDGSGFDLLDLINKKSPDAGIIVNSAFDDEEEREKARQKGVDHFLSKPTDFSKITQVL